MSTRYIDIHEPIEQSGLPGASDDAPPVEHGKFVTTNLLQFFDKTKKEGQDRWKRLYLEFNSKTHPGQFEVLQEDLPFLFNAWQAWSGEINKVGKVDVEFRFSPFHEAHLSHTGTKREPEPADTEPPADDAAAQE